MRKIALVTLSIVFVQPALAADSVTSTVASIDTKERVLTLTDRTLMTVSKDVDLDAVLSGMKVVVFARLDEEGYMPATAATPAN